ncbi:hypothetical protein UCD39_22900 [Nitrospirillum sp. BR 11752]|uniref:hypothetical protein n=1 Tax=Nitrospirillum sp. BR 11752 TaxID=3104293 RepID=UPI002EBD15D5|nr:hypothetical protein [Nitrospirillum sp. BR 11752]
MTVSSVSNLYAGLGQVGLGQMGLGQMGLSKGMVRGTPLGQTPAQSGAAPASATPKDIIGQDASAGGAKADDSKAVDYHHMTRKQMIAASKELAKAGKIDLTEMGMLQMAGPIGKVGPNGEFVPFTAAERAQIDNRPVDYVDTAQQAIRGLESQGRSSDPTSGYQGWKHILLALQEV